MFLLSRYDKCKDVYLPRIHDFVREGTTVIEWGGVLLN